MKKKKAGKASAVLVEQVEQARLAYRRLLLETAIIGVAAVGLLFYLWQTGAERKDAEELVVMAVVVLLIFWGIHVREIAQALKRQPLWYWVAITPVAVFLLRQELYKEAARLGYGMSRLAGPLRPLSEK